MALGQIGAGGWSAMGLVHGAEGFEDFFDCVAAGVFELNGQGVGGDRLGGSGQDLSDGFDPGWQRLWPRGLTRLRVEG